MGVPAAVEILRGAAREVEKGWCRGIVHNAANQVCAIGALRRVTPASADMIMDHGYAPYEEAAGALAAAFIEQYPDEELGDLAPAPHLGLDLSPESVIWRFNDLVVPDKHAVIAAMEKAANNLEA